MKSVSEIYGLEKTARLGLLKNVFSPNAIEKVLKVLGAPGRGIAAGAKNTGGALQRGASNFAKEFGKTEGLMGKFFLGGSALAAVGAFPGVNLAPVLGGKDSLPNMFLNPKSMTAHNNIGQSQARKDVQMGNLGHYKSYIPKTGGVKMYDHKQIIKEASAGKAVARDALMYGLAGIGIGAGAPLATYGIGKGIRFLSKGSVNRDYKAVVKEDPSLNTPEAKKLYKVLHRTAPTVAREPVMASSILSNMMEIPRITPQTFADVLRLEQLYQATEMPFFSPKTNMKPGDIT